LDRQLFVTIGDGLFLLACALFFIYFVFITDTEGYSVFIGAIMAMMVCYAMFFLGGDVPHTPVFGSLSKRILDERETKLSSKASQYGNLAMFIYVSYFSLIPTNISVSKALLGAIFLQVIASGVAFQILLHFHSPKKKSRGD
jgi:ABC-type phosphate transport system permease subunit